MVMTQAERSLVLKTAAEALKALRSSGSSKTFHAELLWRAVRSKEEPHPRVVREVHQALVEALAGQSKNRPSTLERISGVFTRRSKPETMPLDELLRVFEQTFQLD